MTKLIQNKKIIVVGGLIVFLLAFTFYSSGRSSTTDANTTSDKYAMPVLQLPLSYFSDDQITWGSVNTDRDSDDKNTWEYAAVDEGYRSFPTTNITLDSEDYE